MAAVQTIGNFVISCTSSGFGISVNRKYIGELVGIYLKYATAAVQQLTRNFVRYFVGKPDQDSESHYSSVVDETKQLLMNIVEHAAMLNECVTPSQVSNSDRIHDRYLSETSVLY